MKIALSALSLTLLLAAHASATFYVTEFNYGLNPGDNVDGVGGWVGSEPAPGGGPLAFSNEFPEAGDSEAISLGGAFDIPAASIYTLTRDIATTGRSIGGTNISFDFLFIDSINDFPNRESFGISLITGGVEMFSILFIPQNATPADPEDNSENAGLGARWDSHYSVYGGAFQSLNMGVFEDSPVNFDLQFSPNGATTDFALTLSSAVNSLTEGGTGLAINPDANIDEFAFVWAQIDGNDYGTSLFVVDNLSIIPEPSKATLLALGVLGLLARRRRRA